ncbi:MAG: transcriptional regulator [Pusillimonas sp.]|nr:transcriptional regulator [Pusillimonas sp.]HCP79802.1 transcriptional regulator [Pusillimonas sp.]|tara:strand:- start:367 stop:642 length:276 start_codon:yes stop_codon:yes gene_type:complete
MSTNTVSTRTAARTRIAINLKRLRIERGLSQESMAELADFHRTYVSQLERCVTNISIDGLERIANALGVDVIDQLAPTSGDEEQSKQQARS